LSMVVVVDCSQTVYDAGTVRAVDSLDLVDTSLQKAFNPETYPLGIKLLDANDMKSSCLYSHFEFASHFRQDYLTMCSSFPILSGALLSEGLRLAFVCSSGLPYSFVQQCTSMLHLYWMLRMEGFIGIISEIEKTFVTMYRQKVWFRSGLPQRGEEKYLKSWQLSVGGCNANSARLLDGKTTARKGRQTALPKDMTMEGLHVTEISRLRDILQWKTMPSANISSCHSQIQQIAREEYHSIFMSPLMQSSIKMMQVHDHMGSHRIVAIAEASGQNMSNDFLYLTQQMTRTSMVCSWGLSLGDNRLLDKNEKQASLKILADCFRTVFQDGPLPTSSEKPTLKFSSYTHDVNKSLWGEKGAQSQAHR